MSRGYNKHMERVEALGRLGRHLTRRAGSCCELCEASGVRLDPVEIPPLPEEEPELERCAFLCEVCQKAVTGGGKLDPQEWRFLEGVIWSELPVIQVVAVRLCRRMAGDGIPWAVEVLDGLYLDPEIQAWADEAT